MNLVPYTVTALSRNDIEDTPTNKNVVDGAVVELKTLSGDLVVIYDDENGTNPETQKTCDTDGLCTFYAESGDYVLETNGKPQNISLGVNKQALDNAVADTLAFATSEADRAEIAADAAATSGNIYADTAAGLAATANGDYFNVISTNANNYLDLYRNESNVAVFKKSYPSTEKVNQIELLSISNKDKLQGISAESKQLFNHQSENLRVGQYVSSTDGSLISDAAYTSSDDIAVTQNTSYYVKNIYTVAFYNSSGVFISGLNTGSRIFTTPQFASKMIVSFLNSPQENLTEQMVAQSDAAVTFSTFGATTNPKSIINLTSASLGGGAVTSEQVDFIVTGKNLVNPDKSVQGFMGSNGIFIDSTTYYLSDYIEVEAGETYSAGYSSNPTTMRFYTAFDKDKNAVKSAGSDSSSASITVPSSGVKYYRVSYFANERTKFQLEKGAVTDFEAYNLTLKGVDVAGSLSDKSVTKDKVEFIRSSKNLFDKAAITEGFINAAGVVTSSSGTYSYSDYIEVESGQVYRGRSKSSDMRFYTAYDENKNPVEASGSNDASSIITVPASGVKYYRITVSTAHIDSFQFEKGTSPTFYEPFGVSFLKDNVNVYGYDILKWANTQFTSYGDSITAQQEWQGFVSDTLKLSHTAYGIGGRKVSGVNGMCQDSQISVLPASTELLIVLGGTNDWSQSVPLGAENSTDTNTFYGAYNKLVESLFNKYKTSQILFMTTPYGELPDRITDGSNWVDAATNNEGLTTRDYAEAVRVMSKRWGFSVVDLDNLGWNTFNIDDFTKDDGGKIHPDSLGGSKLASIVIGKLRNQTPI